MNSSFKMNAPYFYFGHLATSHIHLAIKWSTRSDFMAFNVNAHCCLRHQGTCAIIVRERNHTLSQVALRWFNHRWAGRFYNALGDKDPPWARIKNCLGQVRVKLLCWGKDLAIIMPEYSSLHFFFFFVLISHSSFSPSVFHFSTTGEGDIYKLIYLSVLSLFKLCFKI